MNVKEWCGEVEFDGLVFSSISTSYWSSISIIPTKNSSRSSDWSAGASHYYVKRYHNSIPIGVSGDLGEFLEPIWSRGDSRKFPSSSSLGVEEPESAMIVG